MYTRLVESNNPFGNKMIVQNPPELSELIQAEISTKRDDFFKIASSHEVQGMIRLANQRYLHWDEFRYKPLPAGLSPEEAWLYLKMVRIGNQKPTSLIDKNGQPFFYSIADPVLRTLNEVDRWSGEIIGADEPGALPSTERYIISSLMEEAIASSQLEGAATTREKAKEMLRSGRKPQSIDEQMIWNNWRTIQYLRDNRSTKLTPEMLREIHAFITDKTLKDPNEVGRFRKSDDVYVEFRGESVHTPPKHDALPQRIEALCQFANQDDEENWIHPVIKSVMLHFWIGYDHPFTDGNGRTARALFYWYLLSHGYWLFEYLPLSRYFLRAPAQYVRAYLYTETDGNDLTYFLAFNLRAIRIAFQGLLRYITRKQRENAVSTELLRHYRGLNLRQKNLIFHAIRHPEAVYTFKIHKGLHGTAYDTARRDLLSLVTIGFLRREKQGKEFVFVPAGRIIDKLRSKSTPAVRPR